jgi:hypothetical protein
MLLLFAEANISLASKWVESLKVFSFIVYSLEITKQQTTNDKRQTIKYIANQQNVN